MGPKSRVVCVVTAAIVAGALATPLGAAARQGPEAEAVPSANIPAGPEAEPLEVEAPKPKPEPKVSFPTAGTPDYGTFENRFGNDRGSHIHEGQDIMMPAGTPVLAVRDAQVLEVGTDGGRGNYVYLYSPDADETYGYFHMSQAAAVAKGEKVTAGQRLGSVGCTGSCYGDHLHFEVHQDRDAYEGAIDPMPLLKKLDG